MTERLDFEASSYLVKRRIHQLCDIVQTITLFSSSYHLLPL